MGANAELSEGDGNTVKGASGTITATRTLNSPNHINVAGLGAVITSNADLGATVVTRGHNPQSKNGNSGIMRYYDISPANNSGLDAELDFMYDESELNGINEGTLVLFSSEDSGENWVCGSSNCSTSDNIISISGIDQFSRWTAAGEGAPLPVELVSFEASITEDGILLNWQTATEVNNYGFEVERQVVGTEYIPSEEWITIGFVEGNGNSSSPKSYEYLDANSPAGNIEYRLKQIDTNGSSAYYETTAGVNNSVTYTETEPELPSEFSLSQNYPNPFNPTTTIKYSIPAVETSYMKSLQTTLIIYDMLGRKVATLVNQYEQPGLYQVQFSADNLASGTYIYRLTAGSRIIDTKVMMLVK